MCAYASGGTPNPTTGYIYQWNYGLNQNTECAYNISAQYYTVIVKDDRDCIAQASFDLDSVTNSFSSDSVVFIKDTISCFGLYDGGLTVDSVIGGFGGVGPYSYNWTGP